MSFYKFRYLPPEIRVYIWKDALHEEADGRIFFIHQFSYRILPTKNNISPFFSVNVEARYVATSFYNICLPILELPKWRPPELMSCEEWLMYSSKVRWGTGIGSQGQTWTNRERYWYHYALTKFGDAAQTVLMNITDNRMRSRKGCIYFNTTTDRFLLSYEAYTRDKAELIDDYGDKSEIYDDLFVEDPTMDVCAYQMTLDNKAKALGPHSKQLHWPLQEYEIPRHYISSKIPLEVKHKFRNIVFADVKDDPLGDLGTPLYVFGSNLGELWRPEGGNSQFDFTLGELYNSNGEHAGENEIYIHWMSFAYPAILEAPRTLLYLEVLASRSCTLIGEVEKHTAKVLDIIELKIDKPKVDEPDKGESGTIITPSPIWTGIEN